MIACDALFYALSKIVKYGINYMSSGDVPLSYQVYNLGLLFKCPMIFTAVSMETPKLLKAAS